MQYKDYYRILGVERDATKDQIKQAYRKLARKFHPDVSKESDAELRFKEVSEAYEVLKDPEKRSAYDQLGANWQNGQDFRPPPDWDQGFEFHSGSFSGGNGRSFSDFFENLFGQGQFHQDFAGGTGRQARGEDAYSKVMIDLEDSFKGASRSITLKQTQTDALGRPQLSERTLNVKIPKGVRQGQHIRLAKQGGAGFGQGQPGDLYLEVQFKPHPLYRVDGKDIYMDLPITPWEAALGATIKVPTPAGAVELKVAENASSGKKMRLKGRGIPAKQPGDFYVVLQVVVPPANDQKVREAYQQLQRAAPFNPRAQLGL